MSRTLPTTGKDSTVQLVIQPGPGTILPPSGVNVADVAARDFRVSPEQQVITTHHLGTMTPDEDMYPMGFSGSMTMSLRDGRLLAAFDAYQESKRLNLPWEWIIVHTLSFRGANEPPRTVTYMQVELNMEEAYDPGSASSVTVSFRCPRRTVS